MDCVETNTFGANLAALGEYGIAERIFELSRGGCADRARGRGRRSPTADRPRWVLGSIGPGHQAADAWGTRRTRRCATRTSANAAGLIAGGADALLVETSQDLLQAKAAVIGARRALEAAGGDLPMFVQVTVETTGTMLLGSEIGAALTALEPLGIDLIGLNCATGPAEMSEHLRYLAQQRAHRAVRACRTPACRCSARTARTIRCRPAELADAHETFMREYGLSLVGGCCGTTPEHLRAGRRAGPGPAGGRARRRGRSPAPPPCTRRCRSGRTPSYLAIGERTNANGSKAFREAMLAARWDDCVEIAREQIRDGAHLLDLCVDYVGRDGVADMRELAGRFATASTLPIVLDSTEADGAAGRAGDARRPRGASTRSTTRTATAPSSRFAQSCRAGAEHGAAVIALTIDEDGPGPHRRAQGRHRRAAHRRPAGDWGMRVERHPRRLPHLPHRHRPGGDPPRRHRDDRGDPRAQAPLPRRPDDAGLSNVSFGLNPAARIVLNSVFLHECVKAGLDSAIVHAAKIVPIAAHPARSSARSPSTSSTTAAAAEGYDPLRRLLTSSRASTPPRSATARAEELAALPAGRAPGAPHHRRRAQGPGGRPRPGAARARPPSRSSTTPCWRA